MIPIRIRRTLLLASMALVVAAPAPAQWAAVGAMPAPRSTPATLAFANRQAVVTISAVTPDIVRVRFTPGAAHGRDHSYAIRQPPGIDRQAVVKTGAGSSTITTASLRVVVNHAPFHVSILDADGRSLDEDDPAGGLALSGRNVRVAKRLRDDEHVYGFGEKTGPLDKRGWKLGGYSFAMWNSDTYAYDGGTDPLYVSVPFFVVLRAGRAHGIFLDNTWRTSFDVGHQQAGVLSFGSEGGDLDYYFIDGPSAKQVIARYTELTGRIPMPPRWALGYNQCRYSYYPDTRVRFIAQNFRERRIPADVIWLDIHYQDAYKPFTWDPGRFPDPAALVKDLGSQGFKVVTIVDPHPKKEPGYAPYESGMAGDHFVRRADGSVYEAPVWPAQARQNPGPSVFPDFSRPATRYWWGGLYASLVGLGAAGIWNDMNEPAIFDTVTGTMPLDVRHDNEGRPADHREIHNVYGMLMTESTYEGLLRLRPDARPFVLSRASYAGGQKYAAVWPGDNVSDWSHLRATLPMLMGLGLSGFPLVGSDIGGFAEAPSPELFTRWLQAGAFYPFMRTHTTFGTPDQEPWSYGVRHEEWNRRAIELRYELLPHIYNVVREASETGIPAMRPVFLEFPDVQASYAVDDEFMFGGDLLVAPVLREGQAARPVNMPPGRWYDFWTGAEVPGNRLVQVPVTLASIPIFVRSGGMIFRQPVVQHTGQMPGQPLIVGVYPAEASERVLYEDDGETLAYRKGAQVTRTFGQRRAAGAIELTVSPPVGSYRPAARALEFATPQADPVARVTVRTGRQAAAAIPQAASLALLRRQESGWALEGGFLYVRVPDRFEELSVRIER
jgi:alpha-glucosidase